MYKIKLKVKVKLINKNMQTFSEDPQVIKNNEEKVREVLCTCKR